MRSARTFGGPFNTTVVLFWRIRRTTLRVSAYAIHFPSGEMAAAVTRCSVSLNVTCCSEPLPFAAGLFESCHPANEIASTRSKALAISQSRRLALVRGRPVSCSAAAVISAVPAAAGVCSGASNSVSISALAGGATGPPPGRASSTSAIKRHPLPTTVSIKRGRAGSSLNASRIRLIAVLIPRSTSNRSGSRHSLAAIFVRLSNASRRSTKSTSKSIGVPVRRMRTPSRCNRWRFRSSSNGPKR